MSIELRAGTESRRLRATGRAEARMMRIVGATAIALAASMVIQNAIFAVTEPPGYGDAIDAVFTWHAQNRIVVGIAVAQEALHIPLLLGFLSGLHELAKRHHGTATFWSRLAVAAGATLSAIFALYSVLWIGTVLAIGELTEPNALFQLVWQLHAAAFALALPTLGATLVGAAAAAHLSRLAPRWALLLGIVGGSLLLGAGLASLEIADGSALLFVGLPGLAAWFAWLLVTGVRLARARPAPESGAGAGQIETVT